MNSFTKAIFLTLAVSVAKANQLWEPSSAELNAANNIEVEIDNAFNFMSSEEGNPRPRPSPPSPTNRSPNPRPTRRVSSLFAKQHHLYVMCLFLTLFPLQSTQPTRRPTGSSPNPRPPTRNTPRPSRRPTRRPSNPRPSGVYVSDKWYPPFSPTNKNNRSPNPRPSSPNGRTPNPRPPPNNRMPNPRPGSSYCTWSPEPECYESGWPECCGQRKGGLDCPDVRPTCEINDGSNRRPNPQPNPRPSPTRTTRRPSRRVSAYCFILL